MKNPKTKIMTLAIPGLVCGLATLDAQEGTAYTWTGAGQTNLWSDAANWDANGPATRGVDKTILFPADAPQKTIDMEGFEWRGSILTMEGGYTLTNGDLGMRDQATIISKNDNTIDTGFFAKARPDFFYFIQETAGTLTITGLQPWPTSTSAAVQDLVFDAVTPDSVIEWRGIESDPVRYHTFKGEGLIWIAPGSQITGGNNGYPLIDYPNGTFDPATRDDTELDNGRYVIGSMVVWDGVGTSSGIVLDEPNPRRNQGDWWTEPVRTPGERTFVVEGGNMYGNGELTYDLFLGANYVIDQVTQVDYNLVESEGTFSPGHPASIGDVVGTFTISGGDLRVFSQGILEMDMAGAASDKVVIAQDSATVPVGLVIEPGATLALQGTPEGGANYTIIEAPSVSGTFDNVTLNGEPVSGGVTVNYTDTSVTVSVEGGAMGPGIFANYSLVDGWVNTGSWMGWVYVADYPHFYPIALDKYVYSSGGDGATGAWIWVPNN